MNRVKRFTIILIVFVGAGIAIYQRSPVFPYSTSKDQAGSKRTVHENAPTPNVSNNPMPTPLLPRSKVIENDYHIFQTFNNCGPAALSMALSYYGIQRTQAEIGDALRPYQVPKGNNDDKSVTFDELGRHAQGLGLSYYNRPNGDFTLLKQFITQGIPVVTKTTLKPDDDIGHYRIVKGYDDQTKEVIQDDSLQGHDLRYSYDEFSRMWMRFGNEYLVLVPQNKKQAAENILGDSIDPIKAWENSVTVQKRLLEKEPKNLFAHFNLSVAYYYLGQYQQSVAEFELVQNRLPKRTLWYQTEPILAYYELGNYSKVFELTENIFNDENRAFSELYLLRGSIYEKHGNINAARAEYEKAFLYNKNLKEAQESLARITD